MTRSPKKLLNFRRGVVAVFSTLLMTLMLGMLVLSIDIGYLCLVKTELQSAADSAALAGAGVTHESREAVEQIAQEYAGYHTAAGHAVQLKTEDIEFGTWDVETREFTPTASASNAIRVTVRANASCGGATPVFFARIFGRRSQDQSATAIATVNPRDIAFVVDLSGSMNDDTDPGSSGSSPSLIQDVYDDFNFAPYPGNSQYAGEPLGIPNSYYWAYYLTQDGGPLRDSSIPDRYRVTSEDSSSTKTWKAYAWVMEVQLPAEELMPNLIPVPNADDSANYNYWKSYISSHRWELGYESYVEVMMDAAREGTVGGSYTPLSLNSNLCPCPMHDETVAGQSFSFPPREMPTHAARRAIIAAIQVIKDRNQTVYDSDQKDRVSIITFDTINAEAINISLTDDYDAAMQVCTRLQANGMTGVEAGLFLAYEHIKPASQGGEGREVANKIVVLLADGHPNQKRSSISSWIIDEYVNDNPSVWIDQGTGTEVNNWITSGSYCDEKNAALMQTLTMQSEHWYVYAAGIGAGCDYDFMDRVARMGSTANNQGESPRGSGDPTVYEAALRKIFEDIITNPKLRLVQ